MSMEASDFWRKVEKAVESCGQSGDGKSQNTGVGFFIGDMEDIIEEWRSEEHEYGM